MSNYKIEELNYNHLDNVMEIEEKSYGVHHWARDSFEVEIENNISQYLCALCGDRVVGYMGMWKIIDEAHVTNFAVHPDYRRRGVGRLLFINSLERCYEDKIKFITLEVRVSNVSAIKLYHEFGFKDLGTRKNYYQDNNEDALIMWTENIFSENYKKIFEANKIKLNEILR